MSGRLRLPRRSGSFAWGAGALLILALATTATAATDPDARGWGQQALVTLGEASAEISFFAPTRHAVILQEPEKIRKLYSRGDVLFHLQEPTRSLTVELVNPGALVFREGLRGRQPLPAGSPIPGFPGLRFTGTVVLKQVQYRYRAVERIAQRDPVLVTLEGSRAVLEVEVPRSSVPAAEVPPQVAVSPTPQPTPARATLDAGLLSQIRVQEVGPGLYEVKAADLQTVLENAGQVLADVWPIVLPTLSFKTGLQYQITSAASDGIVSKRGYTVTAVKLARQAGIELGDTILSVNGLPVDGFASLYRIYREVRRNSSLRTVEVELERHGGRLTKTYRIR